MSVYPTEELLLDDPLALSGSDVEKNTLDQREPVAARALSPDVTIEDNPEAIMVDEEPDKCYTCHRQRMNLSPIAALVIHVQQNESSKLTIQVCHDCCRRLGYDFTTGEKHQELHGCPILPESKIIVNYPNLSHKCLRCFSLLPSPSLHPVSLQDGILSTSQPNVLQDSGYEFAVYLCNSCAEWKRFSGKMKEVTTLKFPAFDLTARTLFLPPISSVQQPSNSSQAGGRSITYPVSMLVNKAKSLIERFKEEASLSSPPTNITGCMMYIHSTKSSPSTHWSCDGFAFQKSSTRVVRIQNSDHVIRETNWVTAGPGDSETKFRRRTITSSHMGAITLVHYLGEVCTGVQASRDVDLEEEQPNISREVSPQSCNKQTLANKELKRKVKKPSPLFSCNPVSIEGTSATQVPDQGTNPADVLPANHSNSSTDSAGSEDPLLPTILSVSGSVGGVTVMGSSPPLPLLEGPILHSQFAAQYSNSIVNKSSKKVTNPVQSRKTIKVSIPGREVLRPVLPIEPLPFNPGKEAPRPVQLSPQLSGNPGNQGTPTPHTVLQTQPSQVNPAQSFQGLASKIVVSGNKIIVPQNFMASDARLVQVPSGDGTKRLVLINSSPAGTTSMNTAAKTTSVVPSISANTSQVMTTSRNKVTKTPGVVSSIPANTPQVVTTSKNTATKTLSVVSSIPSTHKIEKQNVNLLPSTRSYLVPLSSANLEKEEPETAVDPLETDSSRNPPANEAACQDSTSQTRMNHLERLSTVQANICAEVAEECIFTKSFSDVLIYGATSSEQKNPLRTHSLILSAISPNLRQLLEITERNGDGLYELVIPGVALQEIEALVEEVIGTMLMPPKDDKSVTFTMSENLWTLFAGVRPEEAKLGKSYIHNKPVVSNSFSARLKPMESLTGHWAKQSVCDEQTGQMVIEIGRKRKMVNSEEQSMAKTSKSSPEMSSGGLKLSGWSKQVGLSGQCNIQEKEPGVTSENLLGRYYHIYRDRLPVKTVSVDIKNLHYCYINTVVYVDDKVPSLHEAGSMVEDDCEDMAMVPPVRIRTPSSIPGSRARKKSPEKWIVTQ